MTVTRFYYDADGALVKKTTDDQTTHYVNGGYEELRVGSVAADQLRHGPPGAQDRSNAASSSSAVITGCRKDRNRSMAAVSDRAWCSSVRRRRKASHWPRFSGNCAKARESARVSGWNAVPRW